MSVDVFFNLISEGYGYYTCSSLDTLDIHSALIGVGCKPQTSARFDHTLFSQTDTNTQKRKFFPGKVKYLKKETALATV